MVIIFFLYVKMYFLISYKNYLGVCFVIPFIVKLYSTGNRINAFYSDYLFFLVFSKLPHEKLHKKKSKTSPEKSIYSKNLKLGKSLF